MWPEPISRQKDRRGPSVSGKVMQRVIPINAGSTGPSRAFLAGVSWKPTHELARPQWLNVGRRLGAIARCNRWWIGDWLHYGSVRWGEKYVEAARITGYDPKSLRNIAYVASRFSPSRRRDDLSWSHHAEVAALPDTEQDNWLDLSLRQRLSVADLRIELRASRRRDADGLEQAVPLLDPFVCPHCGKSIILPTEGRKSGAIGS
jgi:hypothetical protein